MKAVAYQGQRDIRYEDLAGAYRLLDSREGGALKMVLAN
jgi:hypothetical protein